MIFATEQLITADALLVDIAGPEPVHIEMSSRGPKKYYEVHRPFNEKDALAHVWGYKTKGATLRHPGGLTRALCYDADTLEMWQCLQEAARILADYGYLPLLEASPVGRGGHCWILYTALVKASCAHAHLHALAPCLQEYKEYWPGRGNHKVRLPGGCYIQPGFAAWCVLSDAHGTLLSTDGTSAAGVLLTYQTPAILVPDALGEPASVQHGEGFAELPKSTALPSQRRMPVAMGAVDRHWHEKYSGSALWFHFTPAQLAALYNERYTLAELLPVGANGMAFSPSVQERTPSTAITGKGRAWVDFSARARQSDGKHDGGDALELAARRNGESRTNKARTLREVAREVVLEARDALEQAARAGEQPLAWVASIMTEAGWQRYRSLCEEASVADRLTSVRGVTGFSPKMVDKEAQRLGCQNASLAVNLVQTVEVPPIKQNAADILAAELGAVRREPCNRCGCPLYYESGPYWMCHWCYPRPLKYGLISHAQRESLRKLLPQKPPGYPSWGEKQ
jgi:hypothetical protein